jgi:predicted site-specific integrase-resolvase
MNLDEYVGRHEAARIKKVSVRTIDRWLKGGILPYIWFRSLVMIERRHIVEMKTPRQVRRSLTLGS